MEQIGRYTILGELGRGGFGIVYKAQDPKINRIVAIKTIPTQELRSFAGGKELYERFSREAQSAGSLSHPNIVTVFELAEDDAVTYIVMEFVPGRSLRDVMSDGTAIPVERKLSLIRQMAEALDFAHENGIIHRDVKPANILVTDAGVAKIADFGVAKIVSQHTMSATGVAVGTPSYMSPEQIMAKGVDGRSDQFSLAVIAYELLTGKQPFDGDSLPALIHQILSIDPPDPATVSEQVERPGSDVLLRGLVWGLPWRRSLLSETEISRLLRWRPWSRLRNRPNRSPPSPGRRRRSRSLLNRSRLKMQRRRTPPWRQRHRLRLWPRPVRWSLPIRVRMPRRQAITVPRKAGFRGPVFLAPVNGSSLSAIVCGRAVSEAAGCLRVFPYRWKSRLPMFR